MNHHNLRGEGDEPLPWEGDPPPEEARDEHGRRVRHDAFTARRKHCFLQALVKSGTVEDAARAVGVDPRTVYRHQEKDPAFRTLPDRGADVGRADRAHRLAARRRGG